MKPLNTHIASWLIVGLTVAPLISADAQQETSAAHERLEQLLMLHDVRYAFHAPRPAASGCEHGDGEHGR